MNSLDSAYLHGLEESQDEILSTQKSQLIREYDKKYNQLCEDKVREERERLMERVKKEIRGLKAENAEKNPKLQHNSTLDQVLKLLNEDKET